jgi:hypothetical protein
VGALLLRDAHLPATQRLGFKDAFKPKLGLLVRLLRSGLPLRFINGVFRLVRLAHFDL